MQIVAGADPPLDQKLKDFMFAPEVASLMTFLPAGISAKTDADKSDPRPGPPRPGPPKSAPKSSPSDKKVTAKSLLASLPDGCQSKLPTGKWICLFYNKGICKNQKKGQCANGLHQCLQRMQQEGAVHRMFPLTWRHAASTRRPVRGEEHQQEAD